MELLIVIAIIGITTFMSAPLFTDLLTRSRQTLNRQNAQRAVSISSQLSSISVAHVLPESLGGVEATLRLLRLGLVVQDGEFQGKFFTIGQISDQNIEEAAEYIEIVFETGELQLGYVPQGVP